MERTYIFAVETDLSGKPCTQAGTGGIFWVDNRLSTENKIAYGTEQVKKYQKSRLGVIGFVLGTVRNKPNYVQHFFEV